MKKYLCGLIGLALLGGNPLQAQTPTAVPAGHGGAPVVVWQEAPCCTPTKTVCVPEQYIKKTTKPLYSSGCEPLCLCYIRGLFGSCGCDSGHCQRPYTRRYL